MVDWSKFKPEVFGSLPVAVLSLILVLFSVSFPYWITNGRADVLNSDGIDDSIPSSSLSHVTFGLFEGRKTRSRGGSCTRTVKWVCQSGLCMMSCGETSALRKTDIDLVLTNQSVSAVAGDNLLCPPCKGDIIQAKDNVISSDSAKEDDSEFDPRPLMVREGMLISVIAFLIIGLLFTFINIIFTVINIANNPVSSIVGIDGLVLWNFIAGLMYLLVIILWGAEFNIKLRKNINLSDTLRPGTGMEVSSHSSIGWCCLLLLGPILLHFGLSVMFAWRQYNRYYNKRSKQDREMRINVQDPSQGGTDILF